MIKMYKPSRTIKVKNKDGKEVIINIPETPPPLIIEEYRRNKADISKRGRGRYKNRIIHRERRVNMENEKSITQEVSDKILDIFKEYKLPYNDAADILRCVREKIGRTIISDTSLKFD